MPNRCMIWHAGVFVVCLHPHDVPSCPAGEVHKGVLAVHPASGGVLLGSLLTHVVGLTAGQQAHNCWYEAQGLELLQRRCHTG